MIGKIQRVPLREVWKHEALDFTRWLQENLDVLNDQLDISLSNAEREQSAGDFNVDLIAEDDAGNPVIIENQLEKSNHDHLGKLITYLVAVGAKTAIWIVADPRPEHVSAVTWLNESVSASFYLLKLEGVRIGESQPAPLLTLIVGPSAEGREVGETKKKLADTALKIREFWAFLLDRAKKKSKLHSGVSPSLNVWCNTGAGRSGLVFSYLIHQHDGAVELYIDRGKESEAENRSIFDSLAAAKARIEGVFGQPLEWLRPEANRYCRIRLRLSGGGYLDDSEWPRIVDRMIDAMILLEKALKPEIAQLQM